ncbi:MAG: prepilin-type N-terminal cleavage/methylation domain-containing protein [Pseudomonadota bacterium]|nr:prepilin-type N-terminal cleavage/methylation domain-containing protein [Pseudomonadota bacterium]
MRVPHRARQPAQPCRGFTLIEVLVALTIMAVMAVLTWRGIDGISRAQQATHRYTDDVLALNAGLAQWRADLDAMMVWPQASISTPPAGGPRLRSLLWDGQSLRITRTAAGAPAAGLRVVAWARHPGTGQWLRWQSAPVASALAWQAAWDAASAWARTPVAQAPASGGMQAVAVAATLEWQLHYFRQNAWTNPLSSGADSAALTDTLPDGVRLLLTLAPGQSLNGPLQIDWVRPGFGAAR